MLSQIQMNAAFMAEERILAGRRRREEGGEKMGSRALAAPSPETAPACCAIARQQPVLFLELQKA